MDAPVRLDFFGDTLESIRSFDPETQRTTAELRALDLVPMAEFQLTSDTIRALSHRLCRGVRRRRPRRHALRSGQRRPPLRRHGALAAAVPRADGDAVRLSRRGTPIVLEPLAEEAAHERLAQIADYYRGAQGRARPSEQGGSGAPYKPLPPDRLYLAEDEWRARLDHAALARLSPFAAPEGTADAIDVAAHAGQQFRRRAERAGRQRVRGGAHPRRGAASGRQARRSSRCGAKARASGWRTCWPSTGCTISPRSRHGRRRWRCRATKQRSPCSASSPASRPPTSR